jgi:hypothetical protein
MTKHYMSSHSGPIRGGKVSTKPDLPKRPVAKGYKKSVSASLVYRPMKLEGSQHVGFSVLYSGKGRRDNADVDKNVLSLVLISDPKFLSAYRPLAGAIARESHAEVLCCAISDISEGVLNDRLIDSLTERMTYRKSKIRSLNVISENQGILDLVHTRLGDYTGGSSPKKVEVSIKGTSVPRRSINLIQLTREPANHTVLSRIANFFGWSKKNEKIDTVQSMGPFVFNTRKVRIDENLKLVHPTHCEMVSKLIIGK